MSEQAINVSDLFSITGKVALVTGGSRGIGAMIARGYVEAGAKVYISARKQAACEETARRLSEIGECVPLSADLSTVAGCQKLADEIKAREPSLNVLVNNAGANWGAPFNEFPEAGWDKVMDTNVKGIFFLTQQLLPSLEAAARPGDPARVINIGSIDGIKTSVRGQLRLLCEQGRCASSDKRARRQARPARRCGECSGAGLLSEQDDRMVVGQL